jgi:hypothetical protein
VAVASPANAPPVPGDCSADRALLESLQRSALGYFPANTSPGNGLVADTSRAKSPCSIAVVGFACATYPIAVARGWVEREAAVAHVLAALRFFAASEQSDRADATGFKGFYYHFLDMQSGARVWRSELSMLDSALLFAGALTAARYFTAPTTAERELRELAETLYHRADWHWAQHESGTIRMGWKPESGFLHYGWEGYTEAILMYVLALGSPTHPAADTVYRAWTTTYQWESLYGHEFLYAGPLFLHQFSHAWIDFRGIRDPFMHAKRCDYFENSRRATWIQREYAKRNPHGFVGYDENGWGLSACEGPADTILRVDGVEQPTLGYAARGVPYGPDDGTLSPPAVLASLPFAPEIVMPALRNLLARYPEVLHDGRLATGVNPTLVGADGRPWVSPGHFGLDQGIVAMMIENHCSGQIWKLLHDCAPIRDGLRRAGFDGGWLQSDLEHPA